MTYGKKAALALAALAATAGLAACGSSDEESKDVVRGPFELVAGAPAGYASLAGEATLERADGGSKATVRLTGLEPDSGYVAHLHTEGCDAADPGGPHFKFDPQGGDEPPNEIHLEFFTDVAGSGRASASVKREVPLGEAGSIVLHEAAAGHHMTTAASADRGEALLVHEGHDHGDSAAPEGSGGGHDEAPAKIACAELEGGSDTASAEVTTVVVRNGEPVGGIVELEYSAGEEVRFEVESDVADEVHVHGYDLMEDVPAGGVVSFDFPAEIEGIFEVELEGRKQQIAELRVNP